jgi:hypothetical protein
VLRLRRITEDEDDSIRSSFFANARRHDASPRRGARLSWTPLLAAFQFLHYSHCFIRSAMP